jgi:uncharacterized protein YcfJ
MIRATLLLLLLPLATAPAHGWDDRTRAAVGAGVGAAVGAAIGGELGGRDGAVLGGAVGGAVGAAVATDDRRDRHLRHRDARDWDDRHHRPVRGRGHRDFCPPGHARKGRC